MSKRNLVRETRDYAETHRKDGSPRKIRAPKPGGRYRHRWNQMRKQSLQNSQEVNTMSKTDEQAVEPSTQDERLAATISKVERLAKQMHVLGTIELMGEINALLAFLREEAPPVPGIPTDTPVPGQEAV